MPNIPLKQLNDQNQIPQLGLGTWQTTGEDCKQIVKEAIALGYRHIDTADAYGNHQDVAEGIKNSGIDRKELFITSKAWWEHLKKDDLLEANKRTLKELQTDYLDLYLIHWPNRQIDWEETFSALKQLKDEGKIKSVGVSNFNIHHLQDALEITEKLELPIVVNQIEFHPGLYQKDLLEFCKQKDIAVTAYSPLARGEIRENPVLQELAETYNKTVAQISLMWLLAKDLITIPKTQNPQHLKDNLNIFDQQLSLEDVHKIDELGNNQRLIAPEFNDFDY